MRVALVHDWLNQRGGAEDVLESLVSMFPDAAVYTSMYWRERMPAAYRAWDVRTTWLDHAPGIYRHHQAYLLLYPWAFSQTDLSSYDMVLSNKSGFCHGVRAGKALHICYCLTPTRYVWDFDTYSVREMIRPLTRRLLRPVVRLLRKWDYASAQRVDRFVAISTEVQARIRHHYNRDSQVIHPPVNCVRFRPVHRPQDYYLIVARLVPYRRIDLAVRAFNRLRLPLVIAGDGRDKTVLQEIAGPTITFLGHVSDDDLPHLFAHCRAYILPGEEDFGIAAVQAQAAGRPVIAYGAGGALDTVIEGKTVQLFRENTAEVLARAVLDFDPSDVDPADCVRNAERFSAETFTTKLREYVERALEQESSRG
jgi:glycosyltransferase involved in cell wall biosynthesis